MEICLIFNYVLDFIYSQHIYSHIFTVHYTIAEWAHGIKLFCHLENFWLQPSLFMGKEYLCQIDWVYDGTVLRISRPNSNQQILFNGHKRIHGIKFQHLSLPNGVAGNFSGPYEVRRHDNTVTGIWTDHRPTTYAMGSWSTSLYIWWSCFPFACSPSGSL